MDGRSLSYSVFKKNVVDRTMRVQEINDGISYRLVAFDGPLAFRCMIPIAQGGENPSDEQTDYELNIQPYVNVSYSDQNNDELIKLKVSSRGWHFQAIEFTQTTASSGSFICQEADGSAISGFTQNFYDGDGNLISDPELIPTCTKTVVDMLLPYDFEIVGGMVKQLAAPSGNIFCHVVAAPHIAAASGGSVAFAKSINLATSTPVSDFDGKTVKYVKYDPVYKSSLIRFTLNHEAGYQHKISMRLNMFIK